MAGPIPLLGLLDELRDFANRRNIGQRMVGGGVRGAATRGLLGMDAPENATRAEREVYENAARASAPVMGLAAAPVAIVKGIKGAKAASFQDVGKQDKDKFLELASTGKLVQAKGQQQEIDDLLKGRSKFAELTLNWDDPKTYDMIEDFEKKGYKSYHHSQRPDAPTYIYRDKKDIEGILAAQTPFDFGRSYGYSDADIANFYLSRRRGNADLAAQDWIRDTSRAGAQSQSQMEPKQVSIEELIKKGLLAP
jgi:hypothetical protein